MTSFEMHTIETSAEDSRPMLENSQKAFGRIPGLHVVMAEAPALLQAYQQLHQMFAEQTSFDNDELTVVWQTINVEHNCTYCVPAHSGIAKRMKVDGAIDDALRDETPLPNARLEALRSFTLAVTCGRGHVEEAELQAFLDAGFTRRQVLEVILGLSQKVMSNYTNHLAGTPVDEAFKGFAWQKAGKDAA
ncbi:carboxymuconolactone decarboxylase family protein [Roseovarius sp. D22-M7]|uniref:carboxymuconolactone decarboxylase family protein n=1 Tax=Roseovarius sp. D22-M7 TaxID=3127116 RepID=UPI00300FE1C5